MNKIFIGIISVPLLLGCHSKSLHNTSKAQDSVDKRRATIDSMMALGDRPDSEEVGPSFEEVKAEHLSRYKKVDHIDTMVIVDNDSLYIHEKFFCLNDSSLIIPKRYLWGGDKTKDFVTHNFGSNITIVKNRDTVFNRTFKKSDFNGVINPEERLYATVLFPQFLGYRKQYKSIVWGYSISIPLTDVGVPAYVAIDKDGKFKVLDEYAKFDEK